MGFCTSRRFFLTVSILQLVFAVERQIFDFLGFLWIPIFVNFFEIIFIIFGFFGAYQYRSKYIIAYLLWQLIWIAWNVFLICLYLNISNLDHETNKVLKLDPNSDSWWKKDGPGCKAVPIDEFHSNYVGCLVDYISVEVVQSGLQTVLALFCVLISIFACKNLSKDAEASLSRKPGSKRMSLYSIEFSSHMENSLGDSDNGFEDSHPPIVSKPMTPRRVKRRSVMQRGSSTRHSNTSRRSHRSSRRMTQNPVTVLLGQQQKCQMYENSAMSPPPGESPLPIYYNLPPEMPSTNWQQGHTNPSYQQSNTSLNDQGDLEDLYINRPASARSSYSNFHGARASYSPPKPYHSHATPQVPQKRSSNPNRNSMRQIAFMNNAPPAYTMERVPNASETKM